MRNIPRFIERFGGLLLVILAVALPVLYFVNGWEMENEHLRTETEIYARQVSSLINRNPDMWKYETIRLEGLLAKPRGRSSCRNPSASWTWRGTS